MEGTIMARKTLFLDIDDTLKDTERYIRRLMFCNGIKTPSIGTVYRWINTDKDLFILEVMSNYNVIPYRLGARDGINLLSTEYNIVLCSGYYYEEERRSKESFANSIGKELILCDMNKGFTKSSVDMSGGILVDDNSEILLTSNADVKFEMYNKYVFELTAERDERTTLVDWFSLVEILMGYSKSSDGEKINEELRGFIHQRVQGYCQACRE